LFHFSLPVWFTELGGFEKKRNLLYFNRYVEKVMEHFGGQVKYFITINEPMIYASQGYLDAVWPPQVHSKPRFLKVAFNLIKAHNRVAKIIKQKNRRAKVSIAYHSVYYYSGDDAWLSRLSAAVMQYFSDDIFISRVAKHCDYLGVNYYVSNRVFGYRIHNEDHHISDLGWNLEPANVEYVAERLYRKYKLPIFITENGLADSNEDNRKQWLAATLAAMHRASAEGVPIIGYIHWSLLDNFEWASGKWPKFGLVEVDYKTYKRQVRPSALWLSKFIKNSWSKD
jgi:beta-glucosidase